MTLGPIDPVFLRLQTLVAGRFSLEREIGRGGMGVVYLARDVALERPVAIKVLAPALAAREDMRARFLREARLAAQCFHPHIVPIHAVEEADDLAWIVMAYVRGETLAERLRRQGTLDPSEVQRLAREVGWALAYAHQRGVVHRDIKPENLLIDASTERFVIADFGIAQGANQTNTPVGTAVAGTARYMAPEQAAGDVIDGRADLYALAVTLFIAASGRAPFDGSTPQALALQHAASPAPSIRQFATALPLSFARAIDRCLAKLPDERCDDAGVFLSAIVPDVREQPLATALHATRDHAAGARTMLFWSVVIGASAALSIAGETPGSFGRAILLPIGQSVVFLFAAAGALRGLEALIEVRKALARGQHHEEVARALTGNAETASDAAALGRSRVAAAALLTGGMVLAFAQSRLQSIALPDMIAELIQLFALLAPPMLIARGAATLMVSSGLSRVIRERITAPLARWTTRQLSRFTGTSVSSEAAHRPGLVDAPTEMILLRAVESAMASASPTHRETLGDVNAIARQLAAKIGALRAETQACDARESDALVLGDASARAAALENVRQARATVQGRLQTAVAALESLRLDVLRGAQDSAAGGLTEQLEAVRDVQRRVDAARDVRRLLATPTPT